MDPTIETRPNGDMHVDLGLSTRVLIPKEGPRPMEAIDDGYPDIILDQRRGYGGLETDNIAEVEAWWDMFLGRNRRPARTRFRVLDDGITLEAWPMVTPYINHSRWVADCPNCADGMICWDHNPYTCCMSCGREYKVMWQTPKERAAVIRYLAIRPEPARNWDPRRTTKAGEQIETPEFLARENVLMHGRER